MVGWFGLVENLVWSIVEEDELTLLFAGTPELLF